MNDIMFTQISLNDFVLKVADEVLNRISGIQITQPIQVNNEVRLHGDLALAKHLGCTVQTVGRLRKDREIPFHRVGRKYYYIASEIDNALKIDHRRFGELRGSRIKV